MGLQAPILALHLWSRFSRATKRTGTKILYEYATYQMELDQLRVSLLKCHLILPSSVVLYSFSSGLK
jgi:hypothetical protein